MTFWSWPCTHRVAIYFLFFCTTKILLFANLTQNNPKPIKRPIREPDDHYNQMITITKPIYNRAYKLSQRTIQLVVVYHIFLVFFGIEGSWLIQSSLLPVMGYGFPIGKCHRPDSWAQTTTLFIVYFKERYGHMVVTVSWTPILTWRIFPCSSSHTWWVQSPDEQNCCSKLVCLEV